MLVTLYRYPHPSIPDKWLYVGQGTKRDFTHRSGRSSFGRRFRKLFPDTLLPEPIRWTEPTADHFEANEAEIVAMFKYHTWRGYPGGMNPTLPGSTDYEKMGLIGGSIGGKICKERRRGIFSLTHEQHVEVGKKAGSIGGRSNKENHTGVCGFTHEQYAEAGRKGGHLGGKTQGYKNVENGHWVKVAMLGNQAALSSPLYHQARVEVGRKAHESGQLANIRTLEHQKSAACKRWNINRGKPCTCGKHLGGINGKV